MNHDPVLYFYPTKINQNHTHHSHIYTQMHTQSTTLMYVFSTYVNTYGTCMRMGARVTYPKKVAWHIYET